MRSFMSVSIFWWHRENRGLGWQRWHYLVTQCRTCVCVCVCVCTCVCVCVCQSQCWVRFTAVNCKLLLYQVCSSPLNFKSASQASRRLLDKNQYLMFAPLFVGQCWRIHLVECIRKSRLACVLRKWSTISPIWSMKPQTSRLRVFKAKTKYNQVL